GLARVGVCVVWAGVAVWAGVGGMVERFRGLLTPEQLEEMRRQAEALPLHPFWLALLQGLVAGPTVNAVAAFGEESGWRGLLLRELEALGFWRASAVIGGVWGVWDGPRTVLGTNYPERPWAGVLMMTGLTVLLSPLLGYLTLRAGSVVAAAIFHGTFNATAGLALLVVRGGSDLTVGVTGLAGFVVLLLADIGLFVFDRRLPARAVAATAKEAAN